MTVAASRFLRLLRLTCVTAGMMVAGIHAGFADDKGIAKLIGAAPQAEAPAVIGDGPDPTKNPVLASILKLGTKLYYLGARGGLDGWMIVKDSKLQIAYAAPGSSNLIIGALFGPSGENISSSQVEAIMDTHPDLKAQFMSQIQGGGPNPAIVGAAGGGVMPAMPGANVAPSVTAPDMPAIASPGERLLHDLQNAASISVGNASAPELIMVMDPTCPHCKATWKMVRDKVAAGVLQVRFVVISRNGEDAEEERAAAEFLHVADPLPAWNKYVDGDTAQLAGTPDPSLVQAVRANHALVDTWHIQHTPFLVYRGKDTKIKIVEGEPEQVTTILNDLLP